MSGVSKLVAALSKKKTPEGDDRNRGDFLKKREAPGGSQRTDPLKPGEIRVALWKAQKRSLFGDFQGNLDW